MKRLLIISFLLFFSIIINAQNFSLTGQVFINVKEPLAGASVVLLQSHDSAFIKATISDSSGNYELKNVQAGTYIIKISFIGYEDYFLEKEITNQSVTVDKIILKEKTSTLKQATVTGTLPPAELKGDTMQYNADAFKVNKDATSEELVTKMPGVTVVDGKVQAQGEDVKQITVDGKKFFGDDPNAVLKNLPAEVIDKIQVFDKKSDQSQFTGFDDGSSSKTMNIITKQQFRNGTFGKVYGGYGYDEKWKGGIALNFFKDKRRISILGNTNNINEQNFSQEDLLGVMASSGGGGNRPQWQGGGFAGRGGPRGGGRPDGGGGNDASNFLVDQKNGITTTNSIGINYTDKWKNVDFTGSYFFNYTDNNSNSTLFRNYVTQQNAGLTYSETNDNASKNFNHRINLKVEWKIDSMNSVLFQPKFSYQKNEGSSLLNGENNVHDTLVSNTRNDYNSNLKGINFSAPLLYRHSFKKKGRTISLNLSPGLNQSKGNGYLDAITNYFVDTLSSDTLNQLSTLNAKGFVSSSNIVYTEPITHTGQLMFNYATSYNYNKSDKETFNFSASDDFYNLLDTSLSNTFNSQYLSQAVGAGYSYQKDKMNLTMGAAYQNAQLKNQQQFPYEYDLNKTFNSILPNAMFQYAFSKTKNLRINYRSNNNVPTASQMQDVINNNNPLQLSSGNPDLQQDWSNNLNIRYSAVNMAKSTSYFGFLSGTYTNNYIANSTYFAVKDTLIAPGITLTAGSQLTKPVNLDGYFNIRCFNNYSFTIKKLKSNMNINFGGSYGRTPGLINNNINNAYNAAALLGFVFSSNISEKFDFSISNYTTYTNQKNSLQQEANSNYLNLNSKFKITLQPWKGLVLQTDLNHQYYSGLTTSYNQNYLLWNAAIGYKFLKNKVAEFRLNVFDILEQNKSYTRNTTETYYEDVQSNVLSRYVMLTFTYNLKFYKSTKPPEQFH